MNKNILVLAPHCDDEVLGCGGILSKAKGEGIATYVAIVTNGHLGAPEIFTKAGTEKVKSEALAAHKLLGVKNTYFLDFPAPRLDTIPVYKLAGAIQDVIMKNQITDLYIPHRGDIHQDHHITFNASIIAARPIPGNPVRNIYAYETLSETEWAAPYSNDAFIPNRFISIGQYIEEKLSAMRCFTTQLKEPPHPRSIENIKTLAKYRGATVGEKYAEAFMVIRQIASNL